MSFTQVPVEKIVEKTVETIQVVEKFVEVPVEVLIEKVDVGIEAIDVNIYVCTYIFPG
jgi:hypothetical protein